MVFIIRSFGGEVCWEGEGSPYDESDGGVTHHVCDRPMEGKMLAQREYVVPQWVCDCANWRILIPCADYRPGIVPPPHLSPFVARTTRVTPPLPGHAGALQMQAKAAREGRSWRMSRRAGADATAGRGGGGGARVRAGPEREAKGYPYSRSLRRARRVLRRGRVWRRGSRGGRRRGGVKSDDDSEEEEEEDSDEEEEPDPDAET